MTIAKGFGCGARFVKEKSELVDALKEMIAYHGPYVLDVAGALPRARPAHDPRRHDGEGFD